METEKYEIIPSEEYLKDIIKHKNFGQKQLIRKILSFIKEIQEHPKIGTGQVEKLKYYEERSVWSRRIDKKHRLVYEIFEEEKRVELLSAYGHYDD